MESFFDYYGGTVRLSFEKGKFTIEPKHVLVICRMGKHWLLTKHKVRGLEFPGGKVESGESLEQAAIREVKEETGAALAHIEQIGEYEVTANSDSFVKAVFYGEVMELNKKAHYFETDGPALIEEDQLLPQLNNQEFSYIMKDQVIKRSLEFIMDLNEKRHV